MIVLIAFATCHGSTQGIAEGIGRRIPASGIDAEVRPVPELPDLGRYDAVVLGSAVHTRKWLPEARRFARRNAAVLRQRPTWLFSVSSVGDQESFFPPRVAGVLRAMKKETSEITTLRSAIRPHEHRNFAGAIARTDWSASGNAFLRMMGGRYDDHRSWTTGHPASPPTSPPCRQRRPDEADSWCGQAHLRHIADDANGAWRRFS